MNKSELKNLIREEIGIILSEFQNFKDMEEEGGIKVGDLVWVIRHPGTGELLDVFPKQWYSSKNGVIRGEEYDTDPNWQNLCGGLPDISLEKANDNIVSEYEHRNQ